MTYTDILKIEPYSLNKAEKSRILTERLRELTDLHRRNCPEYTAMLDAIGYEEGSVQSYEQLPFLPVRLFKDLKLKSVPDSEVVKTMTSSGTSGQSVSRIYLNRDTSANQQKTMVKIVNDFTGSSRMPMIILDCPSVIKNRNMFSARGAGILGFSFFGSKKIYALTDEMKLDTEQLGSFLEEHKGERVLLFGFTFMVWEYFYKELKRLKEEGVCFDLSEGILIHGGGWKKLQSEAVSRDEFHRCMQEVCGLNRIHDYYGMVEQTRCIYMECECGHLHASIFSDVIARRAEDFSVCDYGEKGILQVVSAIPESYPGHSLLTEDEGIILGEDDCPCGRKGKYFKIIGRLKKAEIRGCSDTFAADRSSLSSKTDEVSSETDAKGDAIKRILGKVSFLVGNAEGVENSTDVSPKQPFDEEVLSFLQDFSKALMQDGEAKRYPDVVTLGFWLRKAALEQLKERFIGAEDMTRVGRGVAFHIAPSNVPVNFAYSLMSGLLCGNVNIVRVPSKDFPQVNMICRVMEKCLELHPQMRPYIQLIRYERDKSVNDYLSSICDIRIIWGGDRTIEDLRCSALPTRAVEITFADRYSLAVIDADRYVTSLQEDQKYAQRVASGFYNDTYLSDQNACTSPRVVVWTGGQKEQAKNVFWDHLYRLVKEKYEFSDVFAVDKLTTVYEAASVGATEMKQVQTADNLIFRVSISELKPELMEYRGKTGFFYEYDAEDLMEIREFCNDTHCQTIGLLGDREMLKGLLGSGIKGVDRVAVIGRTMDFDLYWDGYNLVEHLTRVVII